MQLTNVDYLKELRGNEVSAVAQQTLEMGINALRNEQSSVIFVQPVTRYGQCFVPSTGTVFIDPELMNEAKVAVKSAGYAMDDMNDESFAFWLPFGK